jgi:hypothetical protein
MKTELGGDRLGSGNKQEISLKNYERSTHDLGYIWRSSMSSGTLVPFMSEVALPGDSFDIDLDCDVKTLPTVGPLFGSYKVQLDVFECPVRLYQGKLHMNMLNIGMDMSEVLLPRMEIVANYDPANLTDNSQINSSSIYSYLNIRGVGRTAAGTSGNVYRYFNAVPYLGYWDIYKNYYANKQEERGFVIHAENQASNFDTVGCDVTVNGNTVVTKDIFASDESIDTDPAGASSVETSMVIEFKWNNNDAVAYGSPNVEQFEVDVAGTTFTPYELFNNVDVPEVPSGGLGYLGTLKVTCTDYIGALGVADWDATGSTEVDNTNTTTGYVGSPQLKEFPLDNIDDMRMDILEAVRDTTAFTLNQNTAAPYGLGLGAATPGDWDTAYKLSSQEGLGIKTYQSDLFNNWISTEWIDGTNGVNEVTAVSTAGNEFTIDALNLANKVYNMLNRIAISGGSYDDWLDAVYTHERSKSCESPIYHGSLIKELAFEEVVSTTDVLDVDSGTDQPMGTLAGRGRLTRKNKGGKVKIKVSEPSYIVGIASITPRIDYSQGNKWDTKLETMNDFHKPALDEIGFEDLITDQMAWFDTTVTAGVPTYSSAGKQPAWINYMTNVNQCRGNFAVAVGDADGQGEMFMTLNRRYEQSSSGIDDLTTYVDPSKYNQIFAQTQLDSQNFWVQISNRIIARRKMSAKVIPNL